MSMYLCQPKYDITHVVAHIECEFCCTSMKEGHKCLFNLEITAVCCTTDGSGTHGTKKQFQWHSCPDQRFSGLPGIMESFNGTHGIFSFFNDVTIFSSVCTGVFYVTRQIELDPTCLYFEEIDSSGNLYVNMC